MGLLYFTRGTTFLAMLGSLVWTCISKGGRGILFVRAYIPRNEAISAFTIPLTRRKSQSPSNYLKAIADVDDSTKETCQNPPVANNCIIATPWNDPNLPERSTGSRAFRSRQHVNPLASKFQQPTVLSKDWPRDVFADMSKPLFLDIGCSKGGFLLDIGKQRPDDYNYLGLEIRPMVAHQARQRIAKHQLQGRLDFVGCNVNVDLDRLLALADAEQNLQLVTIQFPDPHFKSRHAKRRVVTQELVTTLARFMPAGATVFLQSDVQPVLDDMRLQFRDQPDYFTDTNERDDVYVEENLFGIPTEREVSVLERGLPVYRAAFSRTNVAVR